MFITQKNILVKLNNKMVKGPPPKNCQFYPSNSYSYIPTLTYQNVRVNIRNSNVTIIQGIMDPALGL